MIMALLVITILSIAPQPSHTWTLATADTRIDIEVSDNRPVIRGLEGIADRHNWAGEGMAVPLMPKVWIGTRECPVQWLFSDGRQSADGTTLTLTFHSDAPPMTLESVWRARPGPGPVEHWLTLKNESGERIAIPQQESLALAGLRIDGPTSLWWIKRGGSNASTEGGTFTEPFSAQTHLDLASNCDDGASPVPWLAVQSGKSGLYVGWEFSGLGRIAAQATANASALDVAVGLLPDFKTNVEAGEVFQVPAAFVGCYQGDIDDGAYSLHQWILNCLRPRLPEDIPDPILAYNLYLDAGGANAKEADVLRSAEFCRELGFEVFMPDAMWFPACGDWRWDPARFPNGVSPIEAYVHQSGMRLALWCAWTNGGISEHPDALSVRGPAGHPDWFDSDYPADWKPGPFYGGRICLGSPEARAWEIAKTQWLVSNHKLDYLKHDCGPIVTACNKSTHRHAYGVDASYWATLGYYEVQDKLHEAFPRLMLENCSGGGHIKDFGVIQRTHYTVTTDTLSNLPDRQSIYDSTFAFPPILLQAYTYEREYKVPGDDPGSYLWRSAMMGAWQIDPTNTRIWTEDEKASAQKDAQIYKDWIRPMLKDVKVHHILPRPDGIHWDGMFYWSPGLKRGTLYVFRPNAEEAQQTIRLKGLESAQKYWVWCEDGSITPGLRNGADLMEAGIAVSLPARYRCDLIYVQDAALGKPEGLKTPGEVSLGGELKLELRTQLPAKAANGGETWQPNTFEERWRAAETALIICDMWDRHWARGATERVAAMAPRMNEAVKAARNLGITILHAPSETMAFYKDTPARRRVQEAPQVDMPKMQRRIDPPLPIDDSDGGSDTGEKPWLKAWTRQHPAIEIDQERDGISDNGQEIWNFMQAKGIKRLLIMGVHTNMCILNRSFAIGPMVKRGVPVALVRDLTDAMYNPAMPPQVSHDEGTRLVVEHIEKYFCPTTESAQILGQAKADPDGQDAADPNYRHASPEAMERWYDLKYGLRIHWGIYSINASGDASWPLVRHDLAWQGRYHELYKTWNPAGFDASEWMEMMRRDGLKFFVFTTKHHDGFSMYDTKTKIAKRFAYTGPNAGAIEDCDLNYSIMETPFKRDVVKELCDAARAYGIAPGLYFSHIDWYDADFRIDRWHPQRGQVYTRESAPDAWRRMALRHREQIREILTHYGPLSEVSLDMNLPEAFWPEMKETIKMARSLQPDCLFRNRGIGAYGDYHTPENWIPKTEKSVESALPWQVIYSLGRFMSYDPDGSKYKSGEWIVGNLVDITAKGGLFMVGIGPDGNGEFHPKAIESLDYAGAWLRVNGEAIYATRPWTPWQEGDRIRFTRSKDGKTVYAIALCWPGKTLALESIAPKEGLAVRLLGYGAPLKWTKTNKNGIRIHLPAEWKNERNRLCKQAYAFKCEGIQ